MNFLFLISILMGVVALIFIGLALLWPLISGKTDTEDDEDFYDDDYINDETDLDEEIADIEESRGGFFAALRDAFSGDDDDDNYRGGWSSGYDDSPSSYDSGGWGDDSGFDD